MAWTTLVNGTTADASEVNANFYHVRQGSLLPLGGSTLASTNGAFDLGSSSFRWNKLYVNEIASSVTVSGDVVFSGAVIGVNQRAVFEESYSTPTTTNGASQVTTASWYKRKISTTTVNSIAGVTVSSDVFTIPPGTYDIAYVVTFGNDTGNIAIATRFLDTTNSVTLAYTQGQNLIGTGNNGGANQNQDSICLHSRFVVAATITAELQYFAGGAANQGKGYSGLPNKFLTLKLERVA